MSSCITLQADQPTDHDAWAGTQANYIQPRASEQALHSSPHTWPQSTLLFYSYQLQVCLFQPKRMLKMCENAAFACLYSLHVPTTPRQDVLYLSFI